MGDKQNGHAHGLAEFIQKVDDLRADGNIEGGDRLVGDDELRLHHHGSCDTDTLSLSAGELVGIAIRMLVHKTDGVKHLIHLVLQVFLVADALNNQAFGDNLADGHTRVEGRHGILINHLDLRHQFGAGRDAKLAPLLLLKLALFLGRSLLQKLFVFFLNALSLPRGNRHRNACGRSEPCESLRTSA